MKASFANYAVEQTKFQQLVPTDTKDRILMISGESGIGKTSLIGVCLSSLSQPLRYSVVDLLGGYVSPSNIFFRLANRAGLDNLHNFRRQVTDMLDTSESSSDFRLRLRLHLEDVLQGESVEERRQHCRLLTDAWFYDAENFEEPFLLIFDTFEESSIGVMQWIQEDILPWVANSNKIRLVLAGQVIPETRNDWKYCSIFQELLGVQNVDDWITYAKSMNRDVSNRANIEWACGVTKGNPSQMRMYIETLPLQAKSPSIVSQSSEEIDKGDLLQNMKDAFNSTELREIYLELTNKDYDFLSGENLSEKMMALIGEMYRHGRLADLVALCRELRPRTVWGHN